VSAQDDLLAAFGEPERDAEAVEPVEVGEPAEAVEPAETIESAETVEAEDSAEVVEAAEAPAPAAEVVEAAEAPTSADAAPSVRSEPVPQPEAATVVVEHPGLAGTDPAIAAQASAPGYAPQASAPGYAPQFPPQQPYLDPAAFFAQLQSESAPAAPKKRRWPRLVLRYASALVIAGALGAGTAYAITVPKRTDIPFLATPKDGRYTFPAMARPVPPPGKLGPGDRGNGSFTHYNDLRQYLVPAPIGTVAKDDWEPISEFDAPLAETNIAGQLGDAGLRHVARRSWTTPDGQHTVIELLQFPDHQAAYGVQDKLDSTTPSKVGKPRTVVPLLTVASFGDDTLKLALRTFDQVDGQPGKAERRVVFVSGDVIAVVTTTAPAGVSDVPTTQVVSLEAQMLR
jgi:hypothetical protein